MAIHLALPRAVACGDRRSFRLFLADTQMSERWDELTFRPSECQLNRRKGGYSTGPGFPCPFRS